MSPNSNGEGITHETRQSTQIDSTLIEQTSNNPVNVKHQNTANIFTTTKTDNFIKKLEQQNINFVPSSSSSSGSNPINNGNKSNINKETPNRSNDETYTRKEERLDRMPWFHGLLTRENAEKLLVRDGDYLVRETNKAEKQYVLSGRYKGECRHIFLVDPSGVVRTKDRVFDSISHLIQYHQDNNIPIISKENELLLENAVCCNK